MNLSNKFWVKASTQSTSYKKFNDEKENKNEVKELQEKIRSLTVDSNSTSRISVQMRDHMKTFSSRQKSSMSQGSAYNECFAGSTFPPQYEEECPVNYSLKYSETEICKPPVKNEPPKEKFKDFSDYTETDDQPTNFSLKYAENPCSDEETKNSAFNFYENDKRNFKGFVDYDLDQPTDFTLKYRESIEEDAKTPEFNYFSNNKNKKVETHENHPDTEEPANDRVTETFVCENETPLMFSRCSSLNSLSSFVHITQSIPDDRSSVVSDFSRMTSGIISPSELPDSPTQTAPSSPKRNKPPLSFSLKPDFHQKKSVFEDDVATYKQEDTPVEFSRATSLSSLNIDSGVKSEFIQKVNNPCLDTSKAENRENSEYVRVHQMVKGQNLVGKNEFEKERLELDSVVEMDENLLADCVRAGAETKCVKPHTRNFQLSKKSFGNFISPGPETNGSHNRKISVLTSKHSPQLKLPQEPEKVFTPFEVAEDAVHTYHTEGTPANISHAGSHCDLSNLSMVSGVPTSAAHDISEEGSSGSEGSEIFAGEKTQNLENESETFIKRFSDETKPVPILSARRPFARFDFLNKDQHLIAKDETSAFATENSPCEFSVRSSFSDLTVSVIDSPLCLNRNDPCEEPSSQVLSPLHNVSPQSPNSVTLGDLEEGDKRDEKGKNEDMAEKFYNEEDLSNDQNQTECIEISEKYDEEIENVCPETLDSDSSKSHNFDFYSREPLTPFEEALLEQCIHLGMHQRKGLVLAEEYKNKIFTLERKKNWTTKAGLLSVCNGTHDLKEKVESRVDPLGSSKDWDFDPSEPLSVYEEALLEQCIRLGMPERNNCRKIVGKSSDEGGGNNANFITPLEAALLEQCIRLGMPQKKSLKKSEGTGAKVLESYDETNKIISCVSAQLSKLKMSSECDKDLFKKGDQIQCNCGRKHHTRRKNANCKKPKKFKD